MEKESSGKFLVIGSCGMADAVMSLPALQILRDEYPEAEITLLAKPSLNVFWKMCPSVDHFQGLEAFLPMVGRLRRLDFDRAYILPTSFGSALIPFLAGIPRRVGARGRWRRMMLTEIVHLGSGHQQFEAMCIFGVQGTPPLPELHVPEKSFRTLERKLSHFPNIGKAMTSLFQALENEKPVGARPVITLMPGMARGSEKGWSKDKLSLLAKNLCSSMNAVVLLAGGAEDVAVCNGIEAEGYDIVNLAGQTTFSEWAAILQASDCVVSHNNGGMHLASAVGAPVVGLCGPTDILKAGPLGEHVVLQKDGETRSVATIEVEEVYGAVTKLLAGRQ